VELGAGLAPAAGVSLRGAFTWSDARFRRYQAGGRDLAGNRVPGIAPRRLELAAAWSPRGGTFLAADLVAQSATPVADDPGVLSLPSPAYALAGVRASGPPLRLGRIELVPGAGVSNLFDARYNASVVVNAARGRYYEPGPGRALHLGIEVRGAAGP
jgi:iron complex outermembrane receptor protein